MYPTSQGTSILPFHRHLHGIQERNMTTLFKWMFTAFFATLAWLITGYAVEYFKPYKKK